MTDRVVRVVLRGEVSSLVGSMSVASRSVRDTVDQITAGTKEAEKFQRGLSTLGSSAGRAGLVAAGGLAAMGKAAVDWESQFAGVEKTVDGTIGQLAALEDELRELARTMPATHQEIAATAEAAGQLGVAREDIGEFTRTMLMLGETTNLTADQAATDIAQMANVLGTSTDEVDNLGAALVALGNDGASTEAQILGMAQRISGAGAQIGLAESDILGIANAMASAGIEVEAGGSSISRVFTEMAKAVSQGGDSLEQIARTAGMTGAAFVESFEKDPARAFVAFTQGLDQINRSGGDVFTTLEQLGLSDIRVSDALLRMAASGDMLTNSLDLGAKAWAENTALAEEFRKRAATTAAETQVAWNNIKDAGIEAGESLLPVLSSLADRVSALAQTFGSLPDPVQESVTGLLAITAVTGGSLWLGASTIGKIADTRSALEDLSETAPRTVRALSGLAKLGSAATAILAVNEALAGLIRSTDASLPGVDALTADLLSLSSTAGAQRLVEGVGDLRKAIDLLRDPGIRQDIGSLYDKVPFGVGSAFADIAPGLAGVRQDAREAAASLDLVDQAMANIVREGSPEQAAEQFEQLATIYGLTRAEQEAALELMPLYSEALAADANSAKLAGDANEQYGAATGASGQSAADAAAEVDALVDAMRDQRDAALEAFDAETQWRNALKAAEKQAAESSAGIRGNSDEALANRDAISALASAWNNQSEAVKNNRARFREARDAFIETATAMGVPIGQAKRLANQLLQIPSSRVIEIDINGDGAITELDRILARARSIPRTIRTDYIVNQINAGNASSGYGGRDGDPRTPYSGGGSVFGPGSSTSDSIPAWLSNGEYVVRAAAVSKYGRGFFDAANAMRLAYGGAAGTVAGTAAGQTFAVVPGTTAAESVGRFTSAVDASSKSLEREKKKRDDLISTRDSLAASVRGNLRSDLFGDQGDSVWLSASARAKSGVGDVMSILGGDIRRAQDLKRATSQLRAKGLNGNALAELLQNGTVDQVKAFAGMSAREIQLYESRFNQRERLTADVGRAAGAAAYGAAIAAQTVQIKQLNQEVRRLRRDLGPAADRAGREFGKQINGAARSAKRRG